MNAVNGTNENIPFIEKVSIEKKEEIEIKKAKPKKVHNEAITAEDEIDKLINNCSKNSNKYKGKITIENKVKLDFDMDSAKKNTIQNYFTNKPVSIPTKPKISESVKLNYTQIKRIVDTSVINTQDTVTNSDLILCILELCTNSTYYGFKYSNKSKIFWENLLKRTEYKNIFANFKPETLKKYWRILSDIKDLDRAVDLIMRTKDLVDRKEIKLLPLISNIVNHLSGKTEDFEKSIMNLLGNGGKINNQFLTKKQNAEELNQIEDLDLEENLKKQRLDNEDAPLHLDDYTMELLLHEENNVKNLQLIKSKEATIGRNKVIIANEKDKKKFEEIEDIIKSIQDTLMRNYSIDYNSEYILDVLKMNSFNISNTFIFLSNPTENQNLCFNEVDDYIIKNMRQSEYFKDILEHKGRSNVEEREKFLLIETDN